MVETFIVKEAEELIYDSEKIDDWKKKCEDLGLEKQLDLANKDKSPIPFECMNELQKRVYETICPAKAEYNKYGRTTIPLEALSLIALSKQEEYFTRIEIWYDDKAPDPIAIGVLGEKYYEKGYYLIARWGHELMSFEALKEKAINIYKRKTLISLRSSAAQTEEKIRNIDVNVDAYFDCQIEQYSVGDNIFLT